MIKSILGIADKILEHFSPKERKRRLRTELEKLQTERSLIIIGKATVRKADRLSVITKRIAELNRLLKNES